MRARFTMIMTAFTLGFTLTACGGNGGEDLSKFTGTWRPTAGSGTTICPGYPSSSYTVSSNLTWTKGVSSDLVQTEGSCVIEAEAAGSTASGHASPCTVSDGAGGTATVTYTSYTFVVAPDGRTAQENVGGTVVDTNGGATASCTLTQTASYEKIGN